MSKAIRILGIALAIALVFELGFRNGQEDAKAEMLNKRFPPHPMR